MMKKKDYNEILGRIEALEKILNGGPGSGNWGHLGRPGQLGGSGKGDGSLADVHKKLDETGKKLADKIREVDSKPIQWRMTHEKAWDKLLGERDDIWDEYDKQSIDWAKKDKKMQKKIIKTVKQLTGVKDAKLVPAEGEDSSLVFTIDFGGKDVQFGRKKFPGATGSVDLSRVRSTQPDGDGVGIDFTGFIRSKRGKIETLFSIERFPDGKVIFDTRP